LTELIIVRLSGPVLDDRSNIPPLAVVCKARASRHLDLPSRHPSLDRCVLAKVDGEHDSESPAHRRLVIRKGSERLADRFEMIEKAHELVSCLFIRDTGLEPRHPQVNRSIEAVLLVSLPL